MNAHLLIIDNYLFGREYLKSAKRLGIDTILVSANALTESDKALANHTISVGYLNEADILQALTDASLHEHVGGILPGHVFHVPLCAALAETLNLPFIHRQAAQRCVNKAEFRRHLHNADIDQGWFVVSRNGLPDHVLKEIKYPCIVKPTDGFASIGVKFITNEADLLNSINSSADESKYNSNKSLGSEFLIEEYIAGYEVSVETVAYEGKTEIVGITGKHFNKKININELGFEIPCQLSDGDEEQIVKYVIDMHEALGINHGLTHTELVMSEEGPRVVEINPRLGGAHLAELYEHGTGVNLYDVAVFNSLNIHGKFKFPLPLKNAAATQWILGEKGKIKKISGTNGVQQGTAERVDIIVRKEVGDLVPGYGDNRDRVVAFVGSGENLADANSNILHRKQLVEIEYC